MKMLYVVNTRLSADAFRVYARVHLDGKATPSAKVIALAVGALSVVGGAVATVRQGPRLLYIATVIFGLLCLFAQQIGLWRMTRQLHKNVDDLQTVYDYRFGETAFDVTYPGFSESVPYSGLSKLVETEGYYFLYTDVRMAHILAKQDFTQGDAAAFGSFIAKKTGLTLLQHKAK